MLKFIIILSFLFSFQSFAQQPPVASDPTKQLIESSLSFLKQKLKDSNLVLTENDAKLIKRSGNTFNIPASLRLKGIASIPMLQEQARVQQIKFDLNEEKEFGYKIVSLKKGSIIQSLGLKKGDILYLINGRKINNDKAANEIFNDLKTSKEIKIKELDNFLCVFFKIEKKQLSKISYNKSEFWDF
jgi:C-terminal processing protease CtpA/Prc